MHMAFRMVRPLRRKNSTKIQLRARIPRDVLAKARGIALVVPIGDETIAVRISDRAEVVTLSLRTRDPAAAKLRISTASAYLQRVWQGLRDGPKSLTHKQVLALAGETYRTIADGLEDEPGPSAVWANLIEISEAALKGNLGRGKLFINVPPETRSRASLEDWFGPTVDAVLAGQALVVDDGTRSRLLVAVATATIDAARKLKRNAEADYRPDPMAARFPPFDAPKSIGGHPKETITSVFDAWWKAAKARGKTPSTYDSYGRTFRQFVAFLKHDDAGRVTPRDVVAFKNYRLAQINPRSGRTISANTVKNSDLAALKSVFKWAVENLLMATNPAMGVTQRPDDQPQSRDKDFTEDEARAILGHALRAKRGAQHAKTFAAKRWGPWLCAYSGARVGEILQLRKDDVSRVSGQWIITITPEAGTVKTKKAREVPLHAHLIELGFTTFVAAAAPGHLFVTPGKGGDVLGPLGGVKNRVREFVREVVHDPNVAPNHGWRHLFKTIGVEVGIKSVSSMQSAGTCQLPLAASTGRPPRSRRRWTPSRSFPGSR